MPNRRHRSLLSLAVLSALFLTVPEVTLADNTYNLSSDTTIDSISGDGNSIINLNGYTGSVGSINPGTGGTITINGPGTAATQDGGVIANLTVNNANLNINPSGDAYNWLWVTTGTAPDYGSPDDYLPLLNGTLTLNNVKLTNWSGVRANTFVTSGNTQLIQIQDGFSGSFAGNNLINTGALTISSQNPISSVIDNNGADLLVTQHIDNSGVINIQKGGSLYLGYVLSGLPETISGTLGNVNVSGGTLLMNNANLSGSINEAGGMVSGYGTFNGNIANNGGSFFPGNNLTFIESKDGVRYLPTELPNQLTINGNYSQSPSSTYVAYIWPGNNNNTRLNVDGYVSLAGTLAVTAEPSEELNIENGKPVSSIPFGPGQTPSTSTQPGPQYSSGMSYQLISAKYVSGSFSKAVYVDDSTSKPVENSINGLTPYLAYSNQEVLLTLCKAGAGYCGQALQVVNPQLVSTNAVPHLTLAQLEGNGVAVVSNIIGGAPAGAWIRALGNFGHLAGYDTSGAGMVTGYGFQLNNGHGHWVFGPAFSYGYNTIGSGYANANTDSYGFWLYGGWNNDSWKVSAVGGGGFTNNSEDANFGGIRSSQSNYSGSFWDLGLRPSYWLHMSNGVVLSPRVTFNYGDSRSSGFTQTYGPVNYAIPGANYGVFTVSPAMLLGDDFNLGALSIDPQLRVGLDENVGPTRSFGLPHTQGTAEARLNVDESKNLFGVLSWKYTYGGGSGYGYNTIMASARYIW